MYDRVMMHDGDLPPDLAKGHVTFVAPSTAGVGFAQGKGMTSRAGASSDCVQFLSLLKEPKRRRVLSGSRRETYPAGAIAYTAEAPDYAIVVERGLNDDAIPLAMEHGRSEMGDTSFRLEALLTQGPRRRQKPV